MYRQTFSITNCIDMSPSYLLYLVFLLLPISLHAQQWANYTRDLQLSDVYIDDDEVWVGSQGGLTKTNLETGEFQSFLAGNSPIRGGGISGIERSPFGVLWFTSENAGIFTLTNGTWKHYDEGLLIHPYSEISHLQILPSRNVWALVNNGDEAIGAKLVRIKDDEVDFFGNLPTRPIAFAAIDDSTMYIITLSAVFKYDVSSEQIIATFNPENSIINEGERILGITVHNNGTVLFYSESRLFKLASDNISILFEGSVYFQSDFKDSYGNIYINTHPMDPTGKILAKYNGHSLSFYSENDLRPFPTLESPRFLGAAEDGSLYGDFGRVDDEFRLFRYDGNEWTPVKTQLTPLGTNHQDDVGSDCDGNIWFSSTNGVDVRYTDGTWEHFPIQVGQSYSFNASAMEVDTQTCSVWFANYSNKGNSTIPGIIKISNGIVTEFLYDNSNVYDLEATPDGKIYFFSAESKFGYIENDEVHLIPHFDIFQGVTKIDSDKDGNIYLAGRDLGLIKYDGESFTYLGTGAGGDYAFYVYVDNDDLVWVRTLNGLMQFDGAHWHDFSSTWPEETVCDMIQDKKGNFWVATYAHGLYYWDKTSTQHYTIFNSDLTTNLLRGVSLDNDGNLIVTQLVGASVLEIPDIFNTFRGTGMAYLDKNQNGIFEEVLDIPAPGQKVTDLDDGSWTYTSSSGQYAFYSEVQDEHMYEHNLESGATSTTDNPQQASLPTYESVLPDFGYWKEYEPDVEVFLQNGITICNQHFNLNVNVRNKNIEEVNGILEVHYDDVLEYVESSIPPDEQYAGRLVYSNLTLGAFKGRNILIQLVAPGVGVIDTALIFSATYETADSIFSDDTSDDVLCAYDPNDKKVEPTGDHTDNFSLLTDPLRYTIRFQNEGNYKAFDIIIIDTLDSNLDPTSFNFLASSHPVDTRISNTGIITFTFENINLPAKEDDELGSQGFVSYEISPVEGISNYQKVFNSASIYFDFNPPIQTNKTEWNLIDNLLLLSTNDLSADFSVFPNPSTGVVFFETSSTLKYQIFDSTGKQLNQGKLFPGQNPLELNLNQGLYIIRVMDQTGAVKTQKLVIL